MHVCYKSDVHNFQALSRPAFINKCIFTIHNPICFPIGQRALPYWVKNISYRVSSSILPGDQSPARKINISGVRSVRICPLSLPLKHNIILNRQIQKTTLFTGLYRSCKGKQCLPLSFLQVRVLQNVDHDRLETTHETLLSLIHI